MDVPLVLVEDAGSLAEAVRRFAKEPAIAMDTEADSLHHYQEKVCLIQVSIPGCDYILDPLKIGDMSALADILSDPDRVKVVHGGDYDVVSMKRDFGFQLRNIFDTMIAARFLALPNLGLADLVGSVFRVELDKRYQRHDWSARPLEPDHLDYARGDTHWLLALREVLLYKLTRAELLDAAREECARLEEREWQGRSPDPAAFLRVKGASDLGDEQKMVLRALVAYRDQEARRMDRPVFKVIPDRVLIAAARHLPASPEDLGRIMRRSSKMMRQHGQALLDAVSQGLQDETPLPEPAPRPSPRPSGSPIAPLLAERLKQWRARQAEKEGQIAMLAAPNSLIREVARSAPTSVEELAALSEVRQWQVERHGEAIVDMVRACAESQPERRRRRRRR